MARTQEQTNNHQEGWHHKLNTHIGRIHPNIHSLVKTLKDEQAVTDTTIQRARLGAAPKPWRRRYRNIDSRLECLAGLFNVGEMCVNDFLDSVRHIVHNF